MLKQIRVLGFIIPFLFSCKGQDVTVVKIEEASEPIYFNYPLELSNYHLSGQLEEVGTGYVNFNTGFFRYLDADSKYDSLVLPKSYLEQSYNIIPNSNGTYYFLESEKGAFYQLTKEGPMLLDSLNFRQPLKNDHLAVSILLNVFNQASFKDETHLIVPLTLNYFNWDRQSKRLEHKPIPMFCEYDIVSKTIRLLHFLTPKEMYKLDYAGKESDYFGCVNGDTLVISRSYRHELIVYSISQDKVLGEVSGQSTFQKEPIKEFGYSGKKKQMLKLDRYETETPYYSSMFYNKYRQEYYRIFYHPLPEKNEKGEFTVWQDKASSILVFDKNLNLKKEILYEKDNYIMFGLTCTKKGFFVNTYTKEIDGKRFCYEVVL